MAGGKKAFSLQKKIRKPIWSCQKAGGRLPQNIYLDQIKFELFDHQRIQEY